MAQDKIIVRGAKEHNLKNVNVEIPRNKLVVITGLSGSGKSSLAFDTIYAEGQRRYVESLSSYARMFLGQMDKPNVESIEGLSPAISIDQKTTSKNPRSTVGTVTEIYDYLRLLYARIGVPHCTVCGREIRQQTVDQIVDKIMTYETGTKIQIMAPVVRGRKGEHAKVLDSAGKSGYVRARVDGIIYDLSENIPIEKNKKHNIEIIVDRLLREFKVEANIGAPQVAYKETIRKEASVDEKYARQSGGKGQYGHVKINIYPNKDKGYEFVNNIVGGAIPKEYIPAVDQGIQGAMLSGVVAGYNVVDVKVELYDGSYHEVDSSEMAFKIAGSMAFKNAMKKADPVLLEPIMKVTVITPEEYLGDVIGDLNSRRGMIQSMEADNGVQRVIAHVPLSEMFGYATDMRSKTQGRGQYVMEPDTYAEVPKNIAEKIMSERAKKD